MRFAILAVLLATGCSSASASPDAPGGGDASPGDDASGSTSPGEDASPAASDARAEGGDAACVLSVDDAGVTHGCGKGSNGPGDRDDGGDAGAPPPPDAALDASDLPLGAPCWENAQCASDMCFDYAVKGTFCSRTCTSNADCPAPSLGCNGMGVCREGN